MDISIHDVTNIEFGQTCDHTESDSGASITFDVVNEFGQDEISIYTADIDSGFEIADGLMRLAAELRSALFSYQSAREQRKLDERGESDE